MLLTLVVCCLWVQINIDYNVALFHNVIFLKGLQRQPINVEGSMGTFMKAKWRMNAPVHTFFLFSFFFFFFFTNKSQKVMRLNNHDIIQSSYTSSQKQGKRKKKVKTQSAHDQHAWLHITVTLWHPFYKYPNFWVWIFFSQDK